MSKRKRKSKARKPAPDTVIMVDAAGVATAETCDPTPERMAQYGETASGFKTDTGRIIARLNPVDALYEADDISGDGFVAAGRYISDWYMGGFAQRTTADPSRDFVDGAGAGDAFNAKRMDAAARFAGANKRIGSAYEHALACMVLGEMSMKQFGVEVLRSSPSNASSKGKRMLCKAINCLAGYYAPDMTPPKPRSHRWQAEGARPGIVQLDATE